MRGESCGRGSVSRNDIVLILRGHPCRCAAFLQMNMRVDAVARTLENSAEEQLPTVAVEVAIWTFSDQMSDVVANVATLSGTVCRFADYAGIYADVQRL